MKKLLLVLLTFVCLGCSKEPQSSINVAFESTEQLKEAFIQAYDSNDLRSLQTLIFWANRESEELQELMTQFLSVGLGESSISSVDFIEFEALQPMIINEKEVEFVLPPKFWMVANYAGNDGVTTGDIRLAVGVKPDGQFTIVGAGFVD